MKKYILASTSPRRQFLLKQAGIDYTVVSPHYDENILNKKFSYQLIELIAENKGISASENIFEPAIIISADTVVVYDDMVLGKPKNYDEAFKMLSILNNNEHKVVTSVCVLDTETRKKIIKSDTSYVVFNNLTDEAIKQYIENFKPYDKAGSYGIQELPDGFVKEIKGEFDNIVGLPVKMLTKMLEEITKE